MDTIFLVLKSIILGIVEGVTEFLPVSSTGHIVIFEHLLGFKSTTPSYVEMYTYVIQLGAILAVLLLYWKRILKTLTNFFPKKGQSEQSGFKFWFTVCIACVPGAALELPFGDLADKYLFNTVTVSIALFFGGLWMLFAENKFRDKNSNNNELNISIKQALIIGLFQCLALWPGMSRSASTIIGGWIAGLSTVAAAEFSFFLAIPVMLGMSFIKVIKLGGLFILTSPEQISLVVGFIVSFIVAVAVINKFISYLQKKPMKIFILYRMVFAIVVLLLGFAIPNVLQ